MSESDQQDSIRFCCALGQFRGPRLSAMVAGSSFEEFGYTGMAEWLEGYSDEDRKDALKLLYSQVYLLLIFDQPDNNIPRFTDSFKFVIELLTSAGIKFAVFTYAEMLEKIKLNQPPQFSE